MGGIAGFQPALEFEAARPVDEMAQMGDPGTDLAAFRHVDRRAHFTADRTAQFVGSALIGQDQPFERRQSRFQRRGTPGWKGGPGRGDSTIRIGLSAQGDRGNDLFRRRIDHVAKGQFARDNPASVDIERVQFGHGGCRPSIG